MRVLLFASAPTHDYQILRTLLVRESDKKKVELSIYLQPAPGQPERRQGIVQDVEPDRFLTRFPFLNTPQKVKPEEEFYNLASYDVIIAFDPDWTELSADELQKVQAWVNEKGGLITIGGPVNTVELARPGANRDKLKPIIQ